jgi:hypothetical protein
VFSEWSIQSGYKEEFSGVESSFETPAWKQRNSRDSSLRRWQFGRIMARKELGCEDFMCDLK